MKEDSLLLIVYLWLLSFIQVSFMSKILYEGNSFDSLGYTNGHLTPRILICLSQENTERAVK
jgi:hypothetical protein